MLLAYNFTKEFYPIGFSRKLAYFFTAPVLQNACLAFLQVLKKICKYIAKILKIMQMKKIVQIYKGYEYKKVYRCKKVWKCKKIYGRKKI